MKCSGCLITSKDAKAVKCTHDNCGKVFCSLCINSSGIDKKSWKCPDCSAVLKRGGDNSLTPIRSSVDQQNVTIRKKGDSTSEVDMKELTAAISRLTTEFTSLKTRLEEVTQSLSHCHDRMEELMRTVSDNEVRLQNLEKRDHQVFDLQATVMQMQNELNTQAQRNLRNEIEIVGIPESSGENLDHTVRIAIQKVGVQLEDWDVDWVSRVGPRHLAVQSSHPDGGSRMPRPVVMRLLKRGKRDQILRAAKSRRSLSSADLEIVGNPVRIFFNERLTKENRVLFRETRNRAKSQGYSYCWCNNGSIYVRQREGKAAQLIQTNCDLDRIFPPNKNNIS